jgi:hypothetical protein
MEAVSARTLIDPAFFTRLSLRVATVNNLDLETAERITEQALSYLATCATKPAGTPSLYMSRTVDPAWHAFLEYSKPYDEFFESHGWPKVHHNPCDQPGVNYGDPAVLLPRTVAAMESAGFRVELELWTTHVDCDTCGDDDGEPNPLPCGHQM